MGSGDSGGIGACVRICAETFSFHQRTGRHAGTSRAIDIAFALPADVKRKGTMTPESERRKIGGLVAKPIKGNQNGHQPPSHQT